jgi:hypothetical protein
MRGAERLAARDANVEMIATQCGPAFGAVLEVGFQIEAVAGAEGTRGKATVAEDFGTVAWRGPMFLTVVLAARGAGARVSIAEAPRADYADVRALRGKSVAAIEAKAGTVRADVPPLEAADDVLRAVAPRILAVAASLFVSRADCRRAPVAAHGMQVASALVARRVRALLHGPARAAVEMIAACAVGPRAVLPALVAVPRRDRVGEWIEDEGLREASRAPSTGDQQGVLHGRDDHLLQRYERQFGADLVALLEFLDLLFLEPLELEAAGLRCVARLGHEMPSHTFALLLELSA